MSVMMQETECDAGAARLRAEFEVNDALKALKAAVPGSVVAGWIERRVANARKALDSLTRAEAERESAAASVESDAPSVKPKLLVDVDDTPLPNASLTSLGSPTTQIWETPRASVFWRYFQNLPVSHVVKKQVCKSVRHGNRCRECWVWLL